MIDWQLYGDSFTTPDMRALWSETATVAHWLAAEQALAASQATCGVIPQAAADRVAQLTPTEIDLVDLAADTALVGRPIVGLVRQLRDLVGPDVAPFVHFRSTTQDIIDTATAMQMRRALSLLQDSLDRVIAELARLADQHPDQMMIGRTNGQHAVPIRFADKITLWRNELERRKAALAAAGDRGLFVQIGGPVGDIRSYGDDLGPQVRADLARRLDLGVAEPHWQSARDGVAEIATAIGLLCASLCKIAHNVNLLSSSDIGELVEEHREGYGASSSMSHKRNQRASEFGEAVARLGRQRAEQIGEVTLHQHERFGGVWIAEWVILREVFLYAAGALMWAERMTAGMIVKTEVMSDRIRRSDLGS